MENIITYKISTSELEKHSILDNKLIADNSIAINVAGKYFEKRAKENPASVSNWFDYGMFLELTNDYEKALSCYEKAIQLKPNCVFSELKISLILRRLGRSKEALSWIDSLIKKDKIHLIYLLENRNFINNGDMCAEEKECFEEVLTICENISEGCENLPDHNYNVN